MIKNERQYRITKTQAQKFEQGLTALDNYSAEQKNENFLLWETQRSAIEGQLHDLKAEIEEYEALAINTKSAPLSSASIEDVPLALGKVQELDQERINIYRECRRQARVSFDLALAITAASAFVSVVGAVQLLIGHITEGSITASAGVSVSVLCFRLAKDANDRLDKLATELKDD